MILASAACRLHEIAKIPNWILALSAAAAAATYLVLLSSHDLFVVNIYSAMAEAPHFLPTALALLLFVGGWTAREPRRRVSFLATATVAACLSVMVKPHTSMVAALCTASLLVVGLRHFRAFRSPRVVLVCVATAGLVALVQVANWVPKTFPARASVARGLLQGIPDSFAAVTLGSTALALTAMVLLKRKTDLRPEAALVATASFTLAFALTAALAHTFDVGRYLTDLLPFTLLWWMMGVSYLGRALVLVSALAFRRDRRASLARPARLAVEPDRRGHV